MSAPIQPNSIRPNSIQPELHTLPSGLKVLIEADSAAQTIAAGVFVATGARDEAPEQLGASHFLEHLMFKGSDQVSAAELNQRLDALGGHANAFTSDEHTVYHAAALPEQQRELLATLAVLLTPALRPDEINTERGVILEEIEMYADQPDTRLIDALRAQYWGDHPLGHLILGTPHTVSTLDAVTLRQNFMARYGTPQVTLVACGKLDVPALFDQAAELSAQWPSRAAFARAYPLHTPKSALSVQTDAQLLRSQVALCSPGLSTHDPLRLAAQVLADIIGGENGRLYWTLLDTGLCDSADLSHLDYDGAGTFEGGFSCDPTRTQQVLDTFRAVLQEVQQRGVTHQEVQRSARKLAVSSVLHAETPQGRLFSLGMNYLSRQEVLSSSQSVKRYLEITPQDVQAVLDRRPFEVLSITALGPIPILE